MLASNDLLVEIVAELGKRVHSVDNAFTVLQQSNRRIFAPTELVGKIGEISFRLSLEELSKEYGDRVDLDPISSGSTTNHYRFQRNISGNIGVYRGSSSYSDIDEVVLVDGLPVVFEIKMARKSIAKSKKANLGSRKFNYQISAEGVYRKIHPVQDYFDTWDCGMVFVTLPENLKHDSKAQTEFRENGGFLIPLYTVQEFRAEVEFYAKRYNMDSTK